MRGWRSAVALVASSALVAAGWAALAAPAGAAVTDASAYTVPAGDCSVTLAVTGGSGGSGGAAPTGSAGAPGQTGSSITATFAASAGAVVSLQAGSAGAPGAPGVGGSGGQATTASLDGGTVLSAAGGAGGAAATGAAGSPGAGSTFAGSSATDVRDGAGPGPESDGHGQVDVTPNACPPSSTTTSPTTATGPSSAASPTVHATGAGPFTLHSSGLVAGWPAAPLTACAAVCLSTDTGASVTAYCTGIDSSHHTLNVTMRGVDTSGWGGTADVFVPANPGGFMVGTVPQGGGPVSGNADYCPSSTGATVEVAGPSGGPYDFDVTGTLVDPVPHLPGPIDVAGGAGGTPVTYTALATDPTGALVGSATCSPPSGSPFPPGTTTVKNCTPDGQTENVPITFPGSFTVRVDDTPPVITVPGAITVAATGPGGANVTYPAPTVTDPDDSGLRALCNPPSGALFAVGTTTVTCTARDPAGNTASATFPVIVTALSPTAANFLLALNAAESQAMRALLAAGLSPTAVAAILSQQHQLLAFPDLAPFVIAAIVAEANGDLPGARAQLALAGNTLAVDMAGGGIAFAPGVSALATLTSIQTLLGNGPRVQLANLAAAFAAPAVRGAAPFAGVQQLLMTLGAASNWSDDTQPLPTFAATLFTDEASALNQWVAGLAPSDQVSLAMVRSVLTGIIDADLGFIATALAGLDSTALAAQQANLQPALSALANLLNALDQLPGTAVTGAQVSSLVQSVVGTTQQLHTAYQATLPPGAAPTSPPTTTPTTSPSSSTSTSSTSTTSPSSSTSTSSTSTSSTSTTTTTTPTASSSTSTTTTTTKPPNLTALQAAPTPARVSGVSPSGGPAGTVVSITGSGLSSVTGVSWGHGVVSPATFNPSSHGLVTTVPPEAYGDVAVELVTPTGVSSGASASVTGPGGGTFRVTPVISGFSPASGYADVTVTLTGSGLPAEVSFAGTTSPTKADTTGTQSTVVVPRAATTGKLTVSASRPSVSTATPFTVVARPTPARVSGVSPSGGPAGTVVSITGSGLSSVTGVSWGHGVVSPATFNPSSHGLVTTVPPEAYGDVAVELVTPTGVSSGASASVTGPGGGTFRVTPVISGFSPASGYADVTVTLTGSGLPAEVSFAGTTSPTKADTTGTQSTVVVPRAATTGKLTVSASRPSVSTATPFTVVARPTPARVSGVSPSGGPAGTVVSITGSGLSSVTGVSWGHGVVSPATFNPSSHGLVTTVPPEAYGDVAVELVTPTGVSSGASASVTGPGGGTFRVTPVISGFSPASGYADVTVTLTGSGLPAEVSFAGTTSPTKADTTGTQSTVVVPRAATTGKLTVSASRPSVSTATPFVIARPVAPPSPPATPSVSSVSPSGGVAGTVLTVSGSNLDSVTGVQLGGVSATFVVVSKTELDVTVPPDAPAGNDDLVVSTLGGAVPARGQSVSVSPTLTGVSPPAGVPGQTVTILGTGLGGAVDVTFGDGGARATVLGRTGTTVTVRVPTSAAGLVAIELSGAGQSTRTTPTGHTVSFDVLPAPATPSVSSVSPSGGVAGTVLTVSGSNLDSVTGVQLGGVSATFVVVSKTELDVTVPPDAPAGNDDLVVSTLGGAVPARGQSVSVSPTLTGVSPPAGVPGQTVTILGTGLGGAVDVTFGDGGARATVLGRTGTTVTVRVPTSAAGLVAIELSGAGQSTRTTPTGHTVSFDVLPAPATPSVSSVSPSGGVAGTVLTVSGSNLDSVTGVQLGGVSATFVVVSKTELDVTVPPDAPAGNDDLVVSTLGGAVPARGQSVSVSPTLTGVSPPAGVPGQTVTILGTGLGGAVDVTFGDGGARATVLGRTGTTVTVRVPTSAAGLVAIELSGAGQSTRTTPTGHTVSFDVL